jgi:hypothetical protein
MSIPLFLVFALYGRSIKVGTFLVALFTLRVGGIIYVTLLHSLERNQKPLHFTSICIPKLPIRKHSFDDPVLIFVYDLSVGIIHNLANRHQRYGEILFQFVIHGLIWKRTWDLRHFRTILFSVLNRDGLRVFVATIGADSCFLIDLGPEHSNPDYGTS